MDKAVRIVAALLVVTATWLLGLGSAGRQGPQTDPASYIVQADDSSRAALAVLQAGGRITHRLDIIKAVGAQLTPAQLRKVRASEAVRRIYLDRPIKVDSGPCSASGENRLTLDNKKVKWTIGNTGTETLTLNSIVLAWPFAGDKLKKVKLGGKTIYDIKLSPPAATISSGWKGSERDRQIDPADSEELEFEFDKDANSAQTAYSVTLTFTGGCALQFIPSATAECNFGSNASPTFSGNQIKWRIYNDGGSDATIDSVSVTWPLANGVLNKVKLGSKDIFV